MMVSTGRGGFRATSSRAGYYGTRQRRCVQIGCKQQTVRASRPIFNRTNELQKLQLLTSGEPTEVHVLTGPSNCGLSTFVDHFSGLEGNTNTLYLDCRLIFATSPRSFIRSLLEAVATAAPRDAATEVLQQLASEAPEIAEAVLAARKLAAQRVDTPETGIVEVLGGLVCRLTLAMQSSQPAPGESVAAVFGAIKDLLVAWKQHVNEQQQARPRWPVLFIDQACILKGLKKVDAGLVADVLAFLVEVSKELRLCHVVLVTSDSSILPWLQREIGPDSWGCSVIGSFPEQEAREFLNWELERQRSKLAVSDAEWCEVYKACGGNAGTLVWLVDEVHMTEGDWNRAVQLLCIHDRNHISRLAEGGRSEDWTCTEFAAAALELLRHPYHAVPQRDMEALLGRCAVGPTAPIEEQREAGAPVLESLVAGKALSLRPYSDWAADIPAAAFQGGGTVVTAYSAADLCCMQLIKPELELDMLEAGL